MGETSCVGAPPTQSALSADSAAAMSVTTFSWPMLFAGRWQPRLMLRLCSGPLEKRRFRGSGATSGNDGSGGNKKVPLAWSEYRQEQCQLVLHPLCDGKLWRCGAREHHRHGRTASAYCMFQLLRNRRTSTLFLLWGT